MEMIARQVTIQDFIPEERLQQIEVDKLVLADEEMEELRLNQLQQRRLQRIETQNEYWDSQAKDDNIAMFLDLAKNRQGRKVLGEDFKKQMHRKVLEGEVKAGGDANNDVDEDDDGGWR